MFPPVYWKFIFLKVTFKAEEVEDGMLEYVTKLLEVPPIYEPFTPSITGNR